MSASQPHADSGKPTRKGQGGRYLFLFLLGLVIGVVATVMVLRAIESRKTIQDQLPHAVMHLQAWHLGKLDAAGEQSRCNAADTLPHLQALRTTVDDIEPAFPALAEDQRFVKHVSQLRSALNQALASPPRNCEALDKTVATIGQACKSCHQAFR